MANHITSDVNNLQSRKVYEGKQSINVAYDCPMHISHSGTSQFSFNDREFVINKLLTIPFVSKNLLSIKKLCDVKHVCIEFNS